MAAIVEVPVYIEWLGVRHPATTLEHFEMQTEQRGDGIAITDWHADFGNKFRIAGFSGELAYSVDDNGDKILVACVR